jgi:hypothetical protein
MKKTYPKRLAPLFAAALAACGGGGGGGAGSPSPVALIEGTAAIGAAVANANVSITDRSGGSVCTQATIVTSGTGTYSCTLQASKSAPFLVVVTDPSGAHAPMVSVAATTPAAGAALVVNATPLTTALVAQLAPDRNALSVVSDTSLLNLNTLADVTAKVLTQLQPVLTAVGAPAGYDPFSTQIVAATATQAGNTSDQFLETIRISTVNGVPTVSTIDNPAGVALADATTTAPPVLPAPSVTAVSLSESMRLLSKALNDCFAVPLASRVTARDTTIAASAGGPAVTQVAAACQQITHVNYRHNGFTAGQQFYGLLTDANMDTALFSPPELMHFIDDATSSDNDRAVLNLRYVDKNGVAGNIITVAQKFPNTATTQRPTDWWIYGNQQLVDSLVRAYVRRSEQLVPTPGTAPFAGAGPSRFESGIEIFVNKDGPGSTGLRAARVTGPGLPPAGIVLTRPNPATCTDQHWMNIRRKDGLTDDDSATYATATTTNIFKLQRTVGLTGTDATTLRANPNAGNSNSTGFMDWAHPLDYGAALGSIDFVDFSTLAANTSYQFEFYYDGETAPRYTYAKTMVTPAVPAVRGGSLQWHALSAQTLRYLDPADALAAAQPSIDLAWTANPYAPTVRSAGVYTFGGGVTVNQGRVGVARGATTAVANAPGNDGSCTAGDSFRALTADGTSSRTLQLRLRMLDGSYRDMTSRYN